MKPFSAILIVILILCILKQSLEQKIYWQKFLHSHSHLKANGEEISSLNGIEECKDLTIVELSQNQIKYLSQLAALTKISQLYLNKNRIGSVDPLANLTNIVRLELLEKNLTPFDDAYFYEKFEKYL